MSAVEEYRRLPRRYWALPALDTDTTSELVVSKDRADAAIAELEAKLADIDEYVDATPWPHRAVLRHLLARHDAEVTS